MIHGEEYWIDQLGTDEEYDYFLKKIRKKIKKIKPLKIFNPVKTVGTAVVGGLVSPLVKKKKSSQPPVDTKAIVAKATQAKQAELNNDRKILTAEMIDFEKKKSEELDKLTEEKAKVEQASIEAEHGENKKMLFIALIGLGTLVLVGGAFVWIKSRQNQMAALNLQEAA